MVENQCCVYYAEHNLECPIHPNGVGVEKLSYYKSKLFCPKCDKQHIDEGEWAKRLHHKHLCLFCNHMWELDRYIFGVE
jgi:hypothetical protein